MPSSKVISISGIPYDNTEEQVLDIASSVGPVVSSKLLFHKDTGKSKGVCLVEYRDQETAASAVRNLNNYPVPADSARPGQGSRYLKCSYASEDMIVRLLQVDIDGPGSVGVGSSGALGKDLRDLERQIPPLPLGVDVVDPSMDGLNAAIYNVLQSMGPQRQRNLVKDAHEMSRDYPELMRVMFDKNPQLEYAVIQAAMVQGLATSEDIAGLTKAGAGVPAAPAGSGPAVGAGGDSAAGSSLSPSEQAAVQAICAMSDDEIRQQITDPRQQELYLEIKHKYSV